MKSKFTLMFAALVVLSGGMVWMTRDRGASVPAPSLAARSPAAPLIEPATDENVFTTTTLSAVVNEQPAPQVKSSPMVHIDPSGDVEYIARAGDTASELAVALLGSDSKDNRNTVIAANPSLQSNPDRVLEGQTYSIASGAIAADPATVSKTPEDSSVGKPMSTDTTSEKTLVTATGHEMRYTAQAGDTVRVLAAGLLGGDTQANREAIVAGNVSLQQDPDHLVAGQSYTIVAPNGLAADPHAAPAKAPVDQADADDVARLTMGRTLRYTAKPGDTVSKLAVELLGSDTSANRELIIKSNASLKQDPDHLVAGRTYWIAAPTVASKP